LKSSLQSVLARGNAYADQANPDIAKGLDKRVSSALKEAIEEYVARNAKGGYQLPGINAKIGQGLKLEEIAKNAASREAQRNTVGLGDKIIGGNALGGALAAGANPLEAAAQAGGYTWLHNALNRYGNTPNAKALDALSKGAGVGSGPRASVAIDQDEETRRWLEEKLKSLQP